LKVPKV